MLRSAFKESPPVGMVSLHRIAIDIGITPTAMMYGPVVSVIITQEELSITTGRSKIVELLPGMPLRSPFSTPKVLPPTTAM
jgi:hypothetical protein